MLTVKVLLFSVLKERVGEGSLAITLPGPSTIDDLMIYLENRYPIISEFRGVTRVAINYEYADLTQVLQDGDEVALITPVSGG